MTSNTDVANLALQTIGTRTTVSDAELANNSSNEAIQINLILASRRDELMRMAPWNCGSNYVNLALITAAPGTPENTSAGSTLWAKGLPPPPWAYEYQYPNDCLRPLFVIPQFNTGFASGVPITNAVTGGAPAWWQGPPVKFKVGVDQFLPVTGAAIAAAGTGYAAGDVITLASGAVTSAPIGAPVQINVLTVGVGGAIATISVVNQVFGANPTVGGSYFSSQTNPVAQGSTTGSGTGATFNLTFGVSKVDQRVILTNQEFATLCHMKRVTDPNVMDELFVSAWSKILGADLVMALTGDKTLANLKIQECNEAIIEARKADGNEGLTINDVTPDWIRARGINFSDGYLTGPYAGFDWGSFYPLF